MRVVRVLLGVVAILLAIPLTGGGTALWLLSQHQAAGGWFAAALERVGTPGYAVVVPDVDALLRRDASFVQGGDTRLRITARTAGGPLFVGLAPGPALRRYLDGVPHASLYRVRPAVGPLPVTVAEIAGTGRPASRPAEQPFWVAASVRGTVDFAPGSVRGQRLALVLMRPDGSPGLDVRVEVGIRAAWLEPLRWAAIVVGVAGFAAGLALLLWPVPPREIVYVVESRPPEPAACPPDPAEIVDVSSLVATSTAPITPDFEWPPLPAERPAPTRD
jgi:hypothetical protein